MDTSEIRKGLKIMVEAQPYEVVDVQALRPHGGVAFTRVKIRNMASGQLVDKTFKSGQKIEPVEPEERRLEFIHRSGDGPVFMDPTTGEQMAMPEDKVGSASQWLKEGMTVRALMWKGLPIAIVGPA